MFKKEYSFKGRHAKEVDKLTAVFEKEGSARVFERNIDVYLIAPIVGFLYGRKAPVDLTKDSDEKQVYQQHIMGDRVIMSGEDLMFNYQLIMLLDRENEPDEQKRVDKAFRATSQEDEDLYESYVRGGVDILYEKLIDGCETPESYIQRMIEFVDEFSTRFNDLIKIDEVRKLIIQSDE